MKIMNELIKIETNENGEQLVSGRNLHEFLGATERYNSWFKRMLAYGFEENVDYTSVKTFTLVNNGAEREIDNHVLKLDMAKEVAMIQRSEKGKQARQYFIEVEKQFKNNIQLASYMIDDPIKRAEKWIEEQREKQELQQQLTIAEPKANKYDEFLNADGYLTGEKSAKALGIGRNTLYKFLRENEIWTKENIPYQRFIDRDLFKVIPKMIAGVGITSVTLFTTKGVDYVADKLKKNRNIHIN